MQVIASIARDQGGPSYSVPRLAEALRAAGVDSVLRHVEAAGESRRGHCFAYPADRGLLGRHLRASKRLKEALAEDAQAGAIIHSHGLWLLPNVYGAQVNARAGGRSRLLHAPRGMLGAEALAISRWKKRPVWWLMQRKALAAAHCLHATAFSEFEEIRAAGLVQPVAVIPNGVDIPDPMPAARRDAPVRTVLALGRIHPKKGLPGLLRAWALVEPYHPAWRLRIVGNAEDGHDRELAALAAELKLSRATIEGPRYGAEKAGLYAQSHLFCLPTLNENFAMTVAEALAAGIPAISTRGAPWQGLTAEGCGWWIDHGVPALAQALTEAMTLPPGVLLAMGARGRAWMERSFSWSRVASDMRDVYAWLVAGGDAPACVQGAGNGPWTP